LNVNVAERLVLPQLVEVLKSIQLSDENLMLLIEAIKNKFGNQQQYLDKTLSETRAEYDNIKSQLKALTYERIEAVKKGRGISSEMFDQVTEELTNEQQKLNQRLNSLTNANFNFLTTISHLLDFAQRANQLFQDADITTKNKALRFLNANSVLFDKKLGFCVINTYEAIIELNKKEPNGSECTGWCNTLTSLLTRKANELEGDMSFNELVELLQLNGNLLSV